MSDETVRLSFDVSIEEHINLKTELAQARLSIKEFLQQ